MEVCINCGEQFKKQKDKTKGCKRDRLHRVTTPRTFKMVFPEAKVTLTPSKWTHRGDYFLCHVCISTLRKTAKLCREDTKRKWCLRESPLVTPPTSKCQKVDSEDEKESVYSDSSDSDIREEKESVYSDIEEEKVSFRECAANCIKLSSISNASKNRR